jgi:small-conductance mechanosensitive channel
MDIIALDEIWRLITEKLQGWLEAGITLLPNFVVAILLAIIFGLLAKYVGRVVPKVLRKTLESEQIASLLASIIKVLVLFTGLFITLGFLGLTGTVTSLLAGAGIMGLALAFAFQDIIENLIAGIAMGIRKPFQTGDVVEADNVFGTVKTINLHNTLVETFFGQIKIVPNKILFGNILTNYTSKGVRRIEVPVGISYADDPEKAASAIKDVINAYDFVIKQEETAVYAKEFSDSSINLLVWFWIDYPGETGFMEARHTAVVAIKKALENADILIPFPIRTLDFGAKGGEKLNTMLSKKKTKGSDKSTASENEKYGETVNDSNSEGSDGESEADHSPAE